MVDILLIFLRIVDNFSIFRLRRCGLLRPMIPQCGVFVTCLRCAKTAERIRFLFGVETTGNPRHTVLDGVPLPLGFGGVR